MQVKGHNQSKQLLPSTNHWRGIFRLTAVKDRATGVQVGLEANCPFLWTGVDLRHSHTEEAVPRDICNGFNSAARSRCTRGAKCLRARVCSICLAEHPASKCKMPAEDEGKCRRTLRFACHGGEEMTNRMLKSWLLKAQSVATRQKHKELPDPPVLPDLLALDVMPVASASSSKRRRL